MRIRILGAHNLETRDTRHTCFLIDGHIAVDAGSLASALTPDELAGVTHLLLTHGHFDHARDIPSIALATLGRPEPLTILSQQTTLDSVWSHLLDGEVYPDLTRPLGGSAATTRLQAVTAGHAVALDGYVATPMTASHPVPAIGFVVRAPNGQTVAFSGDTGGSLQHLFDHPSAPSTVFVDMTFPDRLAPRALASGHLTPARLREEIEAALSRGRRLPSIVAVHLNLGDDAEITRELAAVRQATGQEIIVSREEMVIG